MALILDDKVVSGLTQSQKTKPAPAPVVPQPGSTADLYGGMGDYGPPVAPPSAPDYVPAPAPVLPSTPPSSPYWVDDPTFVGSGGGYTLDPNTGLVWSEVSGGWVPKSTLYSQAGASGTGDYGEYVTHGGLATPPAPAPDWAQSALDFATPSFLAPEPPAPAPLVIENPVQGYLSPYSTIPGAEGYADDGGVIQVDMTPSSLSTPNITQGNWTWDSTLQTWVDSSGGYIWNPVLDKPQTRSQYLDYITRGTSAERSPFDRALQFAETTSPVDVSNLLPDYLSDMDKGVPANAQWNALAEDLGNTVYGTPKSLTPIGNLPSSDYVDSGYFPVEKPLNYPDLYKSKAAQVLFDIAERTIGRIGPELPPIEESLSNLPTIREGQIPEKVLTPGVSTYFYKEEREPVTGELQKILWRWDGYKAERANYSIAPETGDMVPRPVLHGIAEAVAWLAAGNDPKYTTLRVTGKDKEADALKNRYRDITETALQNNNNVLGVVSLFPGGVLSNVTAELAFATVQVLAEDGDIPQELALPLGLTAAVVSGGFTESKLKALSRGDLLLTAPPSSLSWVNDGDALVSPTVRRVQAEAEIIARENAVLTGREVSYVDTSGLPVQAVDVGSGSAAGVRNIQLPDGTVTQVPASELVYKVDDLQPATKIVDDTVKSATKVTPTDDLNSLLASVDRGGVPAFITRNLEAIAKKYGVDTSGKTPNEVIEELRLKSVVKSTETSADILSSSRVTSETPSLTNSDELVQQILDPTTGRVNLVSTSSLEEALASGKTLEAVRPSSLKRGDNVLLSLNHSTPDFSGTTYKVAEDAPLVTPGTMVTLERVTDSSRQTLKVEASLVWKVGEEVTDEVLYLNAGIPLSAWDRLGTVSAGLINRVTMKTVRTEEGIRKGILLHPMGKENIPANLSKSRLTKLVLDEAKALENIQVPNQVDMLQAKFGIYLKGLGTTKYQKVGKGGATFAMDIAPTADEIALGLAHPTVGDVISFPARYNLTEAQKQAVLAINGLQDAKVAEQLLRGVDLKTLNTESGTRGFMSRAPKAKNGKPFIGGYTGANKKVRIALDETRVWETEAQGIVKDAIEYHPVDRAFYEHSQKSLKRASRLHTETMFKSMLGRDATLDANQALKTKYENTQKLVLSLTRRLQIADKKAGLYETLEDDVTRIYDDVMRAMPDEGLGGLRRVETAINKALARADQLDGRELTEAMTKEEALARASEWVMESKKAATGLKRELSEIIDDLSRTRTANTVAQDQYKAAQNTAKELRRQADEALDQLDDLGKEKTILEAAKNWAITTKADRARISARLKEIDANLKKINKIVTELDTAYRKLNEAEATAGFAAKSQAAQEKYTKDALDSIKDVAGQRAGAEIRNQVERISQLIPTNVDRVAHLEAVISHLEKRIDRLQMLGGKWTEVAGELYDDLVQARNIKSVYKNAWEQSLKTAKTELTQQGWKSVGHEDGLRAYGTDIMFEKKVANQIRDFYKTPEPGRIHSVVKAVNTAILPINLTLDASIRAATMGRLYFNLIWKKPSAMATTPFVELIDGGVALLNKLPKVNITNPADYSRWRTSDEVIFASRFLRLRGEGMSDEFFFSQTMKNVPVFNRLADVAEKDFIRTGNRTMVEMFYAEVAAFKSAGHKLDDASYEQIGRAVNRLAGIPFNKAGSMEADINFAANFFRSHIELHAAAITRWGDDIEGQLARQHLLTTYGMGATLVWQVAAQQGRDLNEVLNPLDIGALEQGEFRLNSNFMTIRIGGVDTSIFGPWRSAAYLIGTLGEAAYMTATKQDPSYLLQGVYYAVSTRATPLIKFGADVLVGHDFAGREIDLLNPSLSLLESAAVRLTPITLQNIWEDARSGIPIQDAIINNLIGFIGGSSNPITGWERRDMFIRDMEVFDKRRDLLLNPDRPASYSNLNSLGRQLVDREYGKLPPNSWDARLRARSKEEIDRGFKENMLYLETEFKAGRMSVDDYLKNRAIELALRNERMGQLYGEYDGYDPRDPVNKYYEGLKKNTHGDFVDWDAFEEWQAKNLTKAERKIVDEYFAGSTSVYTPVDARYRAVSDFLDEKKMYETRDEMFREFAIDNGIDSKLTLNDWKYQLVETELEEWVKSQTFADATDKQRMTDNYRAYLWEQLNNNELVGKWNDTWYDGWTRDFIINNPDMAIDADTFKRISIRKDEAELIYGGVRDTAQMQVIIDREMAKEELEAIPASWQQNAWNSYTPPADSVLVKKETLADSVAATKEVVASTTYGVPYADLTKNQKTAVDKVVEDSKQEWYKVDRSSRVKNFLDFWDTMPEDKRQEFLEMAVSQDFEGFDFLNNTRDLRLLQVANEMRRTQGLPTFDKLLESMPPVTKNSESMNTVYKEMGVTQADLAPRR